MTPCSFNRFTITFSDRYEADAIPGENLPRIAACFDVLPAQAGQVLDDHAVDFLGHNVGHHLLERGPITQNAAVTIIYPFGYQFNVWVGGNVVLDKLLLVDDAVTFLCAVSRVG